MSSPTLARLDGARQAFSIAGVDACWRVHSGSLVILAVDEKDGGRRRELFTREAGQTLLGLPSRGLDAGAPNLVAQPLEPCEVEELALDDLARPLSRNTSAAAELRGELREAIAAWQHHWPEETEPDWPELADAAAWQELPELWRGAGEKLGLGLSQGQRRHRTQQLETLRRRSRAAEEAPRAAAEELASVLRRREAPLPLGSPLLAVAVAVGRHAGIDIKPAAASEDLSRVREPLEPIARASRVRLRRVLLEGEWWLDDCGPLVGRREADGRPVALLPGERSGYELRDPETGERSKVDEELNRGLAVEALSFYRPLPEIVRSAWDLVLFAMRGRRREIVSLGLTGATVALFGMATPHAIALLVDRVLPEADRSLLLTACAALLLIAVGRSCFELTQRQLALRLELLSDALTQSAVWDKLLRLGPGFFRRHETGDLLSRVSAIGRMRAELGGSTLQGLLSGAFALLNFGLLVAYSPKLSLLALAAAVLTAAVTVGSGVWILRLSRELMEIGARVFGLAVQVVDGVAKLRVAGAEDRAFARWSREYARQQSLVLRIQSLDDLVELVGIGVSTLTTIALFYVASNLLQDGELSAGRFLGFNAAFGAFVGGLVAVTGTVTSLLEVAVLHERARPILEEPAEVRPGGTDPGRLRGSFAMERVVFRYREGGPAILEDVDIHAAPGEMIALVGPSGSGKSTVLRLLLGFEQAESGRVLYDGQDLSGLDVSAVRRQVGTVLQSGRINSGSLFEAIAGGSSIELDEAWAALRAAGLAEDVEAMPMGMHTVVSEGGGNLSGGQRQRLFIARALVLKPRLVFLDEATSALDNHTQKIVTESIGALDVTRMVIAHRLSTIQNADRIYVLDHGRVIESGGFEELADAGGLFTKLMKRQLG